MLFTKRIERDNMTDKLPYMVLPCVVILEVYEGKEGGQTATCQIPKEFGGGQIILRSNTRPKSGEAGPDLTTLRELVPYTLELTFRPSVFQGNSGKVLGLNVLQISANPYGQPKAAAKGS